MAMHNIGRDPLQDQKKSDSTWPGNVSTQNNPTTATNNNSITNANLNQQIQQQIQLQQLLLQQSQNQHSANSSAASHLASLAQQYGSINPQVSSTPSLNSRVDQIIRTTLCDSMFVTKNNYVPSGSSGSISSGSGATNHSMNMPPPSSSSPMVFNPASLQIPSAHSNLTSHLGLMSSSSSPHTPIQNSTSSAVDSFTNNNPLNNSGASSMNIIGDLSAKASAHSASHSALAAAAALQSLNQSHLQRSHQLAQQAQQAMMNNPRLSTNSATLPTSAHNSSSMPKLGITSTTSSDHQYHNHLALTANQQNIDREIEYASRLQQHSKFHPGIRYPMGNLTDQQSANLSLAQGDGPLGPRWPYSMNPYTSSPFPSPAPRPSSMSVPKVTGANVTNLSNSNNMIGQDSGDNDNTRLKSNNNSEVLHMSANSQLGSQNIDIKALSGAQLNFLRNNFQPMMDNQKRAIQIGDIHKSQRLSEEKCKDTQKCGRFTMNLSSPLQPGSYEYKRKIPIDSIEDLRQSICCGEFYTKFEEIAIAILSNQIEVPGFDIIEYITRDKFNMTEAERMDSVHKRLGLSDTICPISVAQRYYLSLKASDSGAPQSSDSSLNHNTGIFQPPNLSPQQLLAMKNPNQFMAHLSKSDINSVNSFERGKLSQSPSDIPIKSQPFNNQGQKSINSHVPMGQSISSLSSPASSTNHLPPPPGMNQRSIMQPNARFPPFHQVITSSNSPHSSVRPMRSNPNMGMPGEFEPSSSMKEPPAAHQSSLSRTSVLGTNLSLSHGHSPSNASNCPPVTAHLSSETPQTPRLLQSQDLLTPLSKNQIDSRNAGPRIHEDKGMKTKNPLISHNYTPRPEQDAISNNHQVQTLLALRQQELANRGDSMRPLNYHPNLISNPADHQNLGTFQQHNSLKSSISADSHLASKSPMSHHAASMHQQSPISPAILSKSQDNSMGNSLQIITSMPPPLTSLGGPASYPIRVGQIDEFSPNGQANLSRSSGKDTCPKQSDSPKSINQSNLLQQQPHPQQVSVSDMSSMMSRVNGEVPSNLESKQNNMVLSVELVNSNAANVKNNKSNQRSIITGSASPGSKKAKKVKMSLTGEQSDDSKTSLVDDASKSVSECKVENGSSNLDTKGEKTETTVDCENIADSDSKALHSNGHEIINEMSDNQMNVSDATDKISSIDCVLPQSLQHPLNSASTTSDSATSAQHEDNKSMTVSTCSPDSLVKTSDKTEPADVVVGQCKPGDTASTRDDSSADNLKVSDIKTEIPEPQPRTMQNIVAKPQSNAEPSKYSKFHTKKAWLKNYDQEEDLARKSTKRKLRPLPRRKVKRCPSASLGNVVDSEKKLDDSRENSKSVVKASEDEKTPAAKAYLQTDPCYERLPRSIRCLECRRVRGNNLKTEKDSQSKTNWDDFCRFYEFRKLSWKGPNVTVAGFSDMSDAKDTDKKLWLPKMNETSENMTFAVAKYIVDRIGDDFCQLIQRETAALKEYKTQVGEDHPIIWKRTVNGLRELCDVCSTTLFNSHYVCERCGFVVCLDCHQSRADSESVNHKLESDSKSSDNLSENGNQNDQIENSVTTKKSTKDSYGWIYCTKREEHSHGKLTFAQIIAGNCLEDVLNLLKDIKEEISRPTEEMFVPSSDDEDSQEETKISQQVAAAIEGCLDSLVSTNGSTEETKSPKSCPETIYMRDIDSNVYHYLCDNDLLVLSHAKHRQNSDLFRKSWYKNKPVLVRGVDKFMDIEKWLPQFFAKEFGDYRSDLVDCRNGDIHRHSMKKYWEGFEPSSCSKPSKKKIKEEAGVTSVQPASNEELSNGPSYYSGSALWRLKDWPPGQDFYEILPSHYEDFMNNLPLKHYTTRSGKLNLACRLPKEMLKPDLGPKMYSAYGTPNFPERGTTNLHLDISDAINVMVYVSGALAYQNGSEELKENFEKVVDNCHVDDAMKKEITSKKLVPGALWHVFRPNDAHKMREFLNKVADERNISMDKRTDPIHDQTWYLDQTLLDRMEKEYGVKSYAILQCMGDAILIPAGAPHQVKNLQNCIKVANDFVSPENIRYCLQLTDEFRNLPETHINQEDKLQIKNIIYHSMKEALQYLSYHLRKS